jgi:predicted TPR repeat methyltransferase
LYAVPGLYEKVIYTLLGCNSPRTVRQLLQEELAAAGTPPQDLRVLDLGAGNGIVGEELTDLGVPFVVGVDIIAEAKVAAQRDRMGIYDHYHVVDMTALDERMRGRFGEYGFNALTCVAALGFGDIPIHAFAAAYNLIAAEGHVAFNIKEDFLSDRDESGFAALLRRMIRQEVISVRRQQRYVHRRATNGSALHYVAMVGRKQCDIGAAMLLT